MEEKINEQLVLAENQRMETERLILRPVTLADAADMYAYAKDEETTRFVFDKHNNLEETRASIATYFMAQPLGKYAIEYKENQRMIGTIDLRVDSPSGRAELGYALNSNYWGQGIMPEAACTLLKLGFEQLHLVRIFAIHDLRNLKSGRVMEKIGMKKESTVQDSRILKGEVVDIVTYSLSRKEWEMGK